MTDLEKFSIKAKNLKCIGDAEQGFECIKPINLIIGRNNSGKSTLLDIIERTVNSDFSFPSSEHHSGEAPQLIAESPLTEGEASQVFRSGHSGGGIRGDHGLAGKRLIGFPVKWNLSTKGKDKFVSIDYSPNEGPILDPTPEAEKYIHNLGAAKINPLSGRTFKRIHAERDITPEADTGSDPQPNGDGITNLLQQYLNKTTLPRDLVTRHLLKDLNHVFSKDGHFTDITCQQDENDRWEINLEEETKGLIPLSQSGSGLKTIIMVLAYIHLLPHKEKKKIGDYVFGFEELENNLHPALLRRLLSYMYDTITNAGGLLFLTTHSNVEIDMFSKRKDAQIIHVTHDGSQTTARQVKTYIDNRGVLDDLDVKASDLLQSNCIIWVEGPSDRIYINRWISLWADDNLQEGTHYQCVFYGGRLLSHISAEDRDSGADGVCILSVNRHAAVIIDSDKRTRHSKLNNTKIRIRDEIKNNEGFVWVTKGKEIENYTNASVISAFTENPVKESVGQYENFFEYLDGIKKGIGSRYVHKKPLLAERLSPHMTREYLGNCLDLDKQVKQLCKFIRKCNES